MHLVEEPLWEEVTWGPNRPATDRKPS